MGWRVIVFCMPLMGCALVLTGCKSQAQKGQSDVDNGAVAEKLDKVIEKLDAISKDMATNGQLGSVADPGKDIPQNPPSEEVQGSDSAKAPENSADPPLKQRVENLESAFQKLNSLANDSSTKLGDLARIVKTSDNKDMYALDILGAMGKSNEFKGEIKEAVHSTMQREGTVRVVNETPTYKFVRINGGTQKHINAFSERVFHNIPVGTFTLELVGHEPRRNWTLAPPKYEQVIEINVR